MRFESHNDHASKTFLFDAWHGPRDRVRGLTVGRKWRSKCAEIPIASKNFLSFAGRAARVPIAARQTTRAAHRDSGYVEKFSEAQNFSNDEFAAASILSPGLPSWCRGFLEAANRPRWLSDDEGHKRPARATDNASRSHPSGRPFFNGGPGDEGRCINSGGLHPPRDLPSTLQRGARAKPRAPRFLKPKVSKHEPV